MTSPYVHAKAFVADGRTVFVGSENISATSLDDNREVGIILSNSSIARRIETTFNADWRNNAAPPPRPVPTVKPGAKFSVRVTASPPSVRRGQELTITGTTSPGASCNVKVTYPDGYVSRAQALGQTKIADAGGHVEWAWHVGSTVKGTSQATVSCTPGARSATGSTTFQIV